MADLFEKANLKLNNLLGETRVLDYDYYDWSYQKQFDESDQ